MRTAILAGALALFAAPALAAPVKLDTGLVAGVVKGEVESFRGVPFAAPPVGPLRWRAPQPAARWQGVRTADKFGFACMQKLARNGGIAREQMSEDCLTLNIFRPAKPARKLPVMVWIHGGSLATGASSQALYDGSAFARGGVILVSINYRLNRLGFFAHPAITAQRADGGRLANYGLMDQVAALAWVKRNIAAFGGDPNNVTIFGESAGGASVDALMVTPSARGLFHKAIAQSGYGRGRFAELSKRTADGKRSAEEDGVQLADDLGLKDPDADALRLVPADKLVDTYRSDGALNFYRDGVVLPQDIFPAFRAGKQAPVPFLLGSNGQEFSNSQPAARATRDFLTPQEEESLAPLYGVPPERLDSLGSDILFTQQARALARMHVKAGHKAWLYLFDVISAADQGKIRGAAHGAELRFVFDNMDLGAARPGEDERKVAATMNAHWRTFAAKGDPGPAWPTYDGPGVMSFTREGGTRYLAVDPREKRLDALSALIDPKS